MAEVGVAFVSIVPSARGFGAKLNSQVGPAATKAGQTGGKQYGGAFKGAVGSALKGIGGVLAAAGIAKFAQNAIREASNLSESINAVNVSYGKNAAEILKIGQNSAKGFGLSKSEFNGFAVQFQSFSKTVAGAGGNVPKTFESIIGRARDFASVMNLEVGQAAELFQSGLAGETEPLRKFGIDLSAAAVNAFAYANGIAKDGATLTETQKVQARYGLLMKKTAKTQGDFANTSGGLANQQRILKAQFTNVSASIGAVVVPALAKFFTFLNNDLGPALKKLGPIFKNAVGFIKDNATTFKVAAAIIGGLFVPSLIVATASLIANTVAWAANGVAMAVATVWIRTYQIAAKVAAAAQWILNAAMSANPIGLVIIAIIALVAGIILLWKKSETFRSIITGLWAHIKSAFITGINFVREHWRAFLAALLAILFGPIGLIVGLIIANWDKIKTFTIAAWNKIKAFFVGLWNGIKSVFWSVINGIVNFVKTRWNNLKTNTTAAFNFVKNIISKAMTTVFNFISTKVTGIIKFFKDMPGKIKSALGNMGKLLLNAGKQIIQGLIDGIQAKFSALKKKLGSVTSLIPKWKGPPKRDERILSPAGQLIIDGLIAGMKAKEPALESALRGITAGIGATGTIGARFTAANVAGGAAGGPMMATLVDPTLRVEKDGVVRLMDSRIQLNNQLDAQRVRFS